MILTNEQCKSRPPSLHVSIFLVGHRNGLHISMATNNLTPFTHTISKIETYNYFTPLIGSDCVGCCHQHHEADIIHEVTFLELRFKALIGLAASTFLSDPSDHHAARY